MCTVEAERRTISSVFCTGFTYRTVAVTLDGRFVTPRLGAWLPEILRLLKHFLLKKHYRSFKVRFH